jgi:hypothetical protein
MAQHSEDSVQTPSPMPSILWACAIAPPSALIVGFLGFFSADISRHSSELTLARWLITGACFGAAAGGFIALLCGRHLPRFFCYLFGAVSGILGWTILSVVFLGGDELLGFRRGWVGANLLVDSLALGFIFLGVLGGAAVHRSVTSFGAKSRRWGWLIAGIGVAGCVPILAANVYAGLAAYPLPPADTISEVANALPGALCALLYVGVMAGVVGAIAGAIRDSAKSLKA